jgi:hypothetical protein
MSQSTLSRVPLLGALCVAAGLVAQAEVEECLKLQPTSYPGTPIGQILVLKGYLSQVDLARMVARQQSFRRTFCATLEDAFAQPEDAAPTPEPIAPSALPELGAFTPAELDNSPLFGAR